MRRAAVIARICASSPHMRSAARHLHHPRRRRARRRAASPAAEWLLDNFHVVAAAARDIRHDLPRVLLPPAAEDRRRRVRRTAARLCARAGADPDERRPPRRASAAAVHHRVPVGHAADDWRAVGPAERAEAGAGRARARARATCSPQPRRTGSAADRLADALDAGADRLASVAAGGASGVRDAAAAAIARVRRRAAALRHELDAALASQGQSIEDAIRAEGRHQASEQASMASLIGSLRLISTFDWSEFFESVSLVEQVLQRDPAGVYARMDFRSRDRYRHAVEELAESDGRSAAAGGAEERRARAASRRADAGRARRARRAPPDRPRPARVRASVAWAPSAGQRVRRLFFRYATPGYLGTIAAGTCLLVGGGDRSTPHAQGWRGACCSCRAARRSCPRAS